MKHSIRLLVFLSLIPCALLAEETNFVRLAGREVHATRILVKFKEGVQEQSRRPFIEGQGLRVRRQYRAVNPRLMCVDEPVGRGRGVALSAEQQAEALQRRMEALRRTGKFEYVEPDYIVRPSLQPTDEAFQDGTLWGLRNILRPGVDIGAETAWDATTGSTNVVVAVIDTGIRYTHHELANQMWRNPDEIPDNGVDDDDDGYVDNVFGINAADDTGDPFDLDDHGTHVAGTIGAEANGGGPHVGVAWNVRLMALKFLNPFGRTSDAIECLNFAVQEGVPISNNSWRGGGFSLALFDALAAARDAGHLFIAAAGNDGLDNDVVPHYPSNYELDNVISVAALDRNDKLANFSNYGLESVDLGAPGVEIYSSTSGSDDEYSVFQGTSMASPHVSGVAALLLAQFPQATYLELRERLLSTTVPVTDLAGKSTTGGRVNAPNALGGSPDGILEISVNPPSGSAVLSPSTETIVVTVSDFLAVTNATVVGYVTNNGAFLTTLMFDNTGGPPDEIADDNRYAADLAIPSLSSNLQMRLEVTAPDKFADIRLVNYVPVPLPENDNFADATKIPAAGGFFSTSSKNATLEPPAEPAHAGVSTADHSLWYNWSPATSGQAILDPAGSAFDTVVAVYTGSSLASLTPVASVDNVGSLKQGYLFFNAVAATTYRIAVAGKTSGEEGLLRLRAAVGGLPDTNAPIVAITGPPSGATLTNNFVTLTGTAFDPLPNASGVNEISLRVNNGGSGKLAFGTTTWQSPLFLPQGFNTIEVVAFDHAGNQSAPATWSLTVVPPPSNDHFVNGQVISNFSGTLAADTTSMTKEFGEPIHAHNEGGHSAWWIFIAPADGLLTLTTTNSDFDTLLGLYTGSAVGALTEVANNDDANAGTFGSQIVQAVLSNVTYRIAIDGYAGDSGVAVLDYSFVAMPVFLVEVTSSSGGGIESGGGYYASNAPVTLTATANPGFNFAGWTGTFSSGANPLTFNVTNAVSLVAQFTPVVYSDDFESGDFNTSSLNWDITGGAGNVAWFVQSNDASGGIYSARSGAIGNLQTSALRLEFTSDGGLASFDVRVSSEAAWDFLKFYVNGSLNAQWSGEVGWLTHQFSAHAGTNRLEWRYVKDAAGSGGEDAAYIDNLQLPLVPTMLLLTNASWGAFDVLVSGPPNQVVLIQASSNLVDWITIETNQAASSVIHFVDPAAGQNPIRYYRGMVPAP